MKALELTRQRLRAFEERMMMRRSVAAANRTSDLIDGLAFAPGETHADLGQTMSVAWQLIASLRSTLRSLEERATRIIPAEIAGLVALWTQLYAFDPGVPKAMAWAAWGTLLLALLLLAKLVVPSRRARFWDTLVPPEVVLSDPRALSPEAAATIANEVSRSLHVQIDRLRRGFRTTAALSTLALTLTAVAYIIDKSN